MGDIFSLRLERAGAFRDALNAGVDYKAMCQWFYLRENQELRERFQIRNDPEYEFPDLRAVRHAVTTAVENVDRVYFEDNPPSLKVKLLPVNGTENTFELEQLSDGYRNLVALVMDFARRLAQAHPNWESPLEAPGILLIDEIELHLHPQWQQKIIPSLRAVFPKTQLLVTTHSPQVLTTVKRENISILKQHLLYAASIHTYGADNTRVMREVMETESRPPDNEVTNKIRRLYALINQDQLTEAMTQCDELFSELGPDEPALIEAEVSIKNREWEKELGL